MNENTSLIVDNVDIGGTITDCSISYNWIVDAYRNINDYMMISNPKKKKTLAIKANKLLSSEFDLFVDLFGKTDITHEVRVYDELSRGIKTYKMYHSDMTFDKKPIGKNEVIYSNFSISLIER